MPKYYVQVQVVYDGEIIADSEEQAEDLAWSAYYGDDPALTYDSVYSIEVEELEDDEDEDEDEDGDDD
jgi:uncharacterized protein (DUF427 family)